MVETLARVVITLAVGTYIYRQIVLQSRHVNTLNSTALTLHAYRRKEAAVQIVSKSLSHGDHVTTRVVNTEITDI